MNIYRVTHGFVEEGQNGNFLLRFRGKLQGSKNDFRKMAASQLLVHRDCLLVKSVDFSNLCCIVSLVTFKYGETFQVFSPKFACVKLSKY